MVEWWVVTAVANAVMVLVYAVIAIEMIRAIVDGRQLLSNPLLTATAAIFVTCTLGHGSHLAHALTTYWTGPAGAAAIQASFGDPRLLVWDAITALVAVYFYTLRSRFSIVYRGAALNEDLAKRERQAAEMHDNIVQGLAEAKLALDLGRRDEGYKAIEATLLSARRMMTDMLGAAGTETALGAGDLRRQAPAGKA